MNINDLKENWNKLGEHNAIDAILSGFENKHSENVIEDFFKTGKQEIQNLMVYLNDLNIQFPKRKALDFGCGIGRLSQSLTDYFDEVYGVDIADSMIKLANKYNNKGNKCKYILNENNDLQIFEDNMFDFIYTNITLQHMELKYIKKYLKEFLRIINPEGFIVFQLPSEPICKNFSRKLKYLLKSILIKQVRDFIYKFQLKILKIPRMEMHGIKPDKISIYLQKIGAKLIDIKQNNSDNDAWTSYLYCICKI